MLFVAAVVSSCMAFGSVGAFRSARSIAKIQHQESRVPVYSLPDDDSGAPSDYDTDDLSEGKHVEVDENESDAIIRDELKRELILFASTTNRGQCATLEEQNLVIDLVTQLEALNPTADPALNSQGDWELCYSSTQSFRSSPFFLAIRAFLGDDNKEVAENAFSIHDMATTGGCEFAFHFANTRFALTLLFFAQLPQPRASEKSDRSSIRQILN